MFLNTENNNKQFLPVNKFASAIEELKMSHEEPFVSETVRMITEQRTPKKMKKSKVQQMASIFNSKITQIIKRDMDVGKYDALVNEFSPETKQQPQSKPVKPVPMPRKRAIKPKVPVPTPRKYACAKKRENPPACFVPEDVFASLSVKDKAKLYTQFVEEMTKINPKFGLVESGNNEASDRGEVIVEKQATVKDLLEELEFNTVFPKRITNTANTIQRMDSMKRACAARKRSQTSDSSPQKLKEDSLIRKVTARPAKVKCSSRTPSPRKKAANLSTYNNKKAKNSPAIFQNQEIEDMFYVWFKESHGKNIHLETQEKRHVTSVDILLEEAINKLETLEIEQSPKKGEPVTEELMTFGPITKPKPSILEESAAFLASLEKETSEKSESLEAEIDIPVADINLPEPLKPSTCSPNAKVQLATLSEKQNLKSQQATHNGVQSLTNQPEIDTKQRHVATVDILLEETITKLGNLEIEQIPKPMQRRKRTIESSGQIAMKTSTKPLEAEESESGLSSLSKSVDEESQPENHKTKIDKLENSFEFVQPKSLRKRRLRKSQVWKNDISRQASAQTTSTDSESDNKQTNLKRKLEKEPSSSQNTTSLQLEPESGLDELDQNIINLVNSTTKIKEAYTLTVNDLETPLCTPRPSISFSKRQKVKNSFHTAERFSPTDVLTDQGFETSTNEADSPLKSSTIRDKQSASSNSSKDHFDFFTPNKSQEQNSFAGKSSARELFSPINKPIKNRRKSFYDFESQRNSLVMEVIEEDKPLEPKETSSNILYSPTKPHFSAKIPTLENTNNNTEPSTGKVSQFWIKCGDFSVTMEINYTKHDRLRLLYEIFSQTSCDTKDLHFGIDDNKFSVHDPSDMYIPRRLPASKGCSHYWFSTGDLTIPFSGKYLTSKKIQRLFHTIKETVEETGVLRFGVDQIEFSNVPEIWYQPSKFSVESQYSMLVGLQTGDSNGLEGRSKDAWPHRPVMISDLDQSDNEEEQCNRLSNSLFGGNCNDLTRLNNEMLATPRNSVAMMNLDSYCTEYESEPLDKLFDNAGSEEFPEKLQKTQTMSVADMIDAVENEKQRLSAVQEQFSKHNKSKPAYTDKHLLDAYKGTPEYVEKLRSIVYDICSIACDNILKECSVEELDGYMYFLSRYAEVCLDSCNTHIKAVLNALLEYKAPPENELQKSHDHNPAALSEHQLRIQASLQRLNIPDWFRQYNQNQKSPDGAGGTGASTYKPGNFTRKRTQDSGRWVGLNSKTTSLSSLGSQKSDRSPLLLSPSAHSHHGGQSTHHTGHQHAHTTNAGATASSGAFSRWSTSHLNSSHTSPSVSQRGSFSRGGPINSSFISVNSGHSVIRNSMRQPYLGWRSQEKLSQRTAHERLASSLLSQQQRTSPATQTFPAANNDKLQPVTPEIQSSIKEVTSAIVHYVNDQTNQQRSRSTSPNSRKCWLESSFVGTRPLDSPQTPIIENTPLISAAQAVAAVATSSSASLSTFRPLLLTNNIIINNNNNNNSSNNNTEYANHNIDRGLNLSTLTGNDIQLTRMNGGLNNGTSSNSAAGGVNLGVERSLSNASLEDVLASLLGLPTHQTGANASDAYARSSTGGVLVSETKTSANQTQQQQQQVDHHHMPQRPQVLQQLQSQEYKENLLVLSKEEQQRLRRRSEGDAATKQKQQRQQLQKQEQQQQQFEQKSQHYATNTKAHASDTITAIANNNTTANGYAGGATAFLPPRRVSLGDSSESNNRTASASGELQIKCRNNKCDRTATPADAKKHYKSCHNCTYLYCSRECRRAHWEKHRKACLHSRVSNLCRQVLASCKDDSDSLRHLSLLARKGFLSQGRGVVRILFRSPESAEGFIKNGFQCMGEASYVRWPDLMPAEMGLELYSELLKLSTEYRPDSKMLVYVAVCVVSEAPGMGQAPVRWERQLVSRCAKLKLCKTVLAELEQQQPLTQPVTVVAVPEPTTEVLILTFNPQLRNSTAQRELVLSNILGILSRRGVILRKHYPEIFQRLQTYTEGQTDKFNPVTLHPRDSHTGQNFVCIIMPVQSETEIIKLPSIADGGNRVTTIDVGSSAALAQLDDDELLTRTTTATVSS